jgi:hypothetical protein
MEQSAPARAAAAPPEWSGLPSWTDQPEESTEPERVTAVTPERSGWSWWVEPPEPPERLELPELPAQRTQPERMVPEEDGDVNISINRPLLGRGQTDAEKLADFLLTVNGNADPDYVRELSLFYVEEAAAEGIDHDVAFAQMCLETGFLRYGGLVTDDMNNFCGLGAMGPDRPGERFPTPQIGVRAQIQHLKGYATEEPPTQELVDPRYKYVRYGSAPTIKGLAGTWAVDRNYAQKITAILNRLYTTGSTPDSDAAGDNAADSEAADNDTADSDAADTNSVARGRPNE